MRSEVKSFLFYFSNFLKPYKLVQEKFEDAKEETKTSKSQKNKTVQRSK
jgi:hypothetical protein